MNFDQLPNAVEVLDEMMGQSLPPFFEELAGHDGYVREHEIVNLFVFGHLVPQFQRRGLDLRQIGIEYPVKQIQLSSGDAPCTLRHLVVWPRVGATLWCGYQPVAVVEWKNISSITHEPAQVRRGHKKDVEWLRTNSGLMQVGYACLVTRCELKLTFSCIRVEREIESRFLEL